jgi:hypothetical protein
MSSGQVSSHVVLSVPLWYLPFRNTRGLRFAARRAVTNKTIHVRCEKHSAVRRGGRREILLSQERCFEEEDRRRKTSETLANWLSAHSRIPLKWPIMG